VEPLIAGLISIARLRQTAHSFSSAERGNLESAFLTPSYAGITPIFCCRRANLFLRKELVELAICSSVFYLKFTLDRED
jgi:hypothetical protein